jgi:hypothetical protein
MNIPVFFDRFGLIIFSFLVVDSLMYLKENKRDVRAMVRLGIGVVGLAVDGYMVFFGV